MFKVAICDLKDNSTFPFQPLCIIFVLIKENKMNTLVLKYNLLDSISKKEVKDFLDFLLSRKKENVKSEMTEYRKNLLQVSTWNKKDISLLSNNDNIFNKWQDIYCCNVPCSQSSNQDYK